MEPEHLFERVGSNLSKLQVCGDYQLISGTVHSRYQQQSQVRPDICIDGYQLREGDAASQTPSDVLKHRSGRPLHRGFCPGR